MLLLISFVCGALYEFLWVQSVNATREKKPVRAANWALSLFGCSLLATLLVVDQQAWAVVAYGLGCWIGTYWSVK